MVQSARNHPFVSLGVGDDYVVEADFVWNKRYPAVLHGVGGAQRLYAYRAGSQHVAFEIDAGE